MSNTPTTLRDLLIGKVHIETKENTECYVEPTCVAVLDVPAIASQIQEQLKALLPEKKPMSVRKSRTGKNQNVMYPHDSGYNQAIDQIQKAIEDFCSGKGKE